MLRRVPLSKLLPLWAIIFVAAIIAIDHSAPKAAAAPDEVAWSLIDGTTDRATVERFLQLFPQSAHAGLARERLAALPAQGFRTADNDVIVPRKVATVVVRADGTVISKAPAPSDTRQAAADAPAGSTARPARN